MQPIHHQDHSDMVPNYSAAAHACATTDRWSIRDEKIAETESPPPKDVSTNAVSQTAVGGEVEIRFTVDVPGPVHLRVYNVDGRRVSTVEYRAGSTGLHRVVWSGRSDRGNSVGPGIYFVRIETPAGSSTSTTGGAAAYAP